MRKNIVLFFVMLSCLPWFLFSQDNDNCFLADFESKWADVPNSITAIKPTETVTATVHIDAGDQIAKVSPYIFGNAVAVWCGQLGNEPVLMDYLSTLSPTIMRFPGGSWSDIFFWDGNANNIPDSLVDGTNGTKDRFWPQFGAGSWPMTVDNFYQMQDELGSQGLITINYGYARYGTGPDPVAEAAEYAADWVRYDDGWTKFWEIGNESGGPWEAGWQIDPELNEDGQPEIITGELYGQHFRIFAEAMRKAADEIGETIYIGAQILHFNGTSSWNIADREWNDGVFQEVGDVADYYVVHNYFGLRGSGAKGFLNGVVEAESMMNFMKQDMIDHDVPIKPIAITEWNSSAENGMRHTSMINGMHGVLLANELIENGYGLSCRWLVCNWYSGGNDHGMFYKGDELNVPAWNPYPDFFFQTYFQQFTGDHMISNSVSGNEDIVAHATTFASGHTGVIIANKGNEVQTIQLDIANYAYGDQYYVYSLVGGDDNGEYSQKVFINGYGPDNDTGGPVNNFKDIEAFAYSIDNQILISSPALSMQFVMVAGDVQVSVEDVRQISNSAGQIAIYPSPARKAFKVNLQQGAYEMIDIIDIRGRVVYSRKVNPTQAFINVRTDLATGYYFVRLHTPKQMMIKKMIILK
ncbi:T9SS type A sorting domain-containing protein [bacterium]